MEPRMILVIGGTEAVALAIGALLCHFGLLAWYLVPLALLVPPVVLVIALLVAFAVTTSNGGNPFQ